DVFFHNQKSLTLKTGTTARLFYYMPSDWLTIVSITPAAIMMTLKPMTIPHANAFGNLPTICRPIAVKIILQIENNSIDEYNIPAAPSIWKKTFKLVNGISGSLLGTK